MPEALFQSIYKDLQNSGFPVEKLRRTKQQWYIILYLHNVLPTKIKLNSSLLNTRHLISEKSI
jgi:hypothetical protein